MEVIGTEEDGAEASGEGINSCQNIRICEATVTLVHRRGRRFRVLLKKVINIAVEISGDGAAELFGDLGSTGRMNDSDFVWVIICGSEELVRYAASALALFSLLALAFITHLCRVNVAADAVVFVNFVLRFHFGFDI